MNSEKELQQQLLQLQIQEQQYRTQKLNLQMTKIPLEQHDPLILLGALLNLTGLNFYDVNQLLLGTWHPKQLPQNIRKYILDDANVPETFLKKASDLKIDFNILVETHNKFSSMPETDLSLKGHIYNVNFPLNSTIFSLKQNKEIRDELLLKLYLKCGLNKNQLALLLNISPSTVSKTIQKELQKKNK